jgi:D-amino-acid dehydrogenase
MSCGSGRVLADLVSGRPSAIGTAELSIDRYARAA